jgi:hypothetical protein
MIAFLQRLRLLSLPLLLSAALAMGSLLCFGRMGGLDGTLPLLAIAAGFLAAIAAAACNGLLILRVAEASPLRAKGSWAGAGLLVLAMLLFGQFAAFVIPVLIAVVAVAIAIGLILGGIGLAVAFGLLTLFAPEI